MGVAVKRFPLNGQIVVLALSLRATGFDSPLPTHFNQLKSTEYERRKQRRGDGNTHTRKDA